MNMTPQVIRRTCAVAEQWPVEMLPLLQRIYAARGCTNIHSACPRLSQLHHPASLHTIDTAVRLLTEAITQQQRILIVGDFDCDGATACAVAVRGLHLFGAKHVAFAVPNRISHGYGLSAGFVEDLERFAPDVLITVDHGTNCHAGVAAAKARGWKVLVTDHHLPGATLPAADAVINPNQSQDNFPCKHLAGVGVIFYVLLALRAHFLSQGLVTSAKEIDLTKLLDLVAVGTIADLVPFDTTNRALVSAGLRQIRQGKANCGLRVLMERSLRNKDTVTTADIAFGIAPVINAAGRLDDMTLGIALLVSDDAAKSRHIVDTLLEINQQRKHMQQSMLKEAEQAVGELFAVEDRRQLPSVICVYDAQWHPGLIGLVASQLLQTYQRPAVAFAPSAPNSPYLRGSARAGDGRHMRDILALLHMRFPKLMESFGGHAKAAGLTIAQEHLTEFTSALQSIVKEYQGENAQHEHILSDGELSAQELNYAHAQAIRLGGPWGQDFPEPLFEGTFLVRQWRVLRERHVQFSLQHPQSKQMIKGIHFNGWKGNPPTPYVCLLYALECDDFQAGSAIQLLIKHVWEAQTPP